MVKENTNSFFSPVLVLLIGLFIFGLFGGAAINLRPKNLTYSKHAKESHRAQTSQIERCFNGWGQVSDIFIQKNGRYAQNCLDPEGNMSWRIMECESNGIWRVVTQYFFDWRSSWDRVRNYMTNHGMQKPKTAPAC